MSQTAEPIARVIADLLARRIQSFLDDPVLSDLATKMIDDPKVVDCTDIYTSLVAKDEPIYVYEDHPCIAPPFTEAAYCYVNEHGNVIVMHTYAYEASRLDWEPAEPVDLERLRWIYSTFVYIGGRSAERGPFPTSGPVHCWRSAVYSDGAPADLHWAHLVPEYPLEHWDMAHLVLLGAWNFLNCRNVEIVEPTRPRAERKRIARTGVSVGIINVYPAGKQTRSQGQDVQPAGGVPLTSVRGHFAEYGERYGKGKLFGKYEGRFWIPQYARGSAELGQANQSYRLRNRANR